MLRWIFLPFICSCYCPCIYVCNDMLSDSVLNIGAFLFLTCLMTGWPDDAALLHVDILPKFPDVQFPIGQRELVFCSCLILRPNLSLIGGSSIRHYVSMALKTELTAVTVPAIADIAASPTNDPVSFRSPLSQLQLHKELRRCFLVPIPLPQMKNFMELHFPLLWYNTAVSQSASLERIFSVAKDILSITLVRLAEESVDNQLLKSSNRRLV